MANKQVRSYTEIEDKILRAAETLAAPVRQTLGPKGGNVIIQTDKGEVFYTNDGVTIAKEIRVKDPFEDSIIQLIRQAALKTNEEAGDGTSTTVHLSNVLIKEGLKMVRDGKNQVDVVEEIRSYGEELLANLEEQRIDITEDEDILNVARISANNDPEIAANTLKTVKVAGQDGLIWFTPNNKTETEIQEEVGFVLQEGMFVPDLMDGNTFSASMQEAPVLITDKRIYYKQEAETILRTCLENGHKQVVIVAQDFIGEALPFFVANHKKGVIKVLLVKDPTYKENKGATLEDLAIFLGGSVVSERAGSIVDKLTINDFMFAGKVHANHERTVISRTDDTPSEALQERTQALKDEKEKLSEGEEKEALARRIASLTNGIVTIKIGAATGPEIAEKRFRYEDAISAARSALKHGILVGGGMAIMNAADGLSKDGFRGKFVSANIRQLAENAGLPAEMVFAQLCEAETEFHGFNASTGQVENLLEAGVVDPYRVTEMAIKNSISIACAIIGSRYMVVTELEDEGGTTSREK